MRLIDADRFEAYCYDTVKGDYHDGVLRVLEDIDKTQTIEAIPVEWIKKFAEGFDNERGHEIKVTVDYAIESMLGFWEWEKENGTTQYY